MRGTYASLAIGVCVVGWVIGTWSAIASAASLTAGDLVASVNEFTGTSPAPEYIAEYTPAGTRVQKLGNVPQPGGTGASTDEARDLVLGPDNAVRVYNGTFTPYLARLDLATLGWTQQTFAGWSTANNISYGGLARGGQYIYATDMSAGGSEQGIVRFDTSGGATVRFATGIQTIDVNVAGNVVYALEGEGGPLWKFDANTLASIGMFDVGLVDDNRAVAAAPDGSIFVATWNGVIKRYALSGALLDSLTVPGMNFEDIDINPDGRIALGTGFSGNIVLTDVSLDQFTSFRATESTFGGEVFIAWVPEPGAAPILLAAAPALLWRRRR